MFRKDREREERRERKRISPPPCFTVWHWIMPNAFNRAGFWSPYTWNSVRSEAERSMKELKKKFPSFSFDIH